ncbi:deoxycytidylate deaminase isoform X2 [Ooceraea biroi]|uniref:dCMP deaminase n=1 Tax=Ooceraea biroi TaxID=2015173 RepID=A0A026VUY4_OOCBI|nr:deoxycytidylate deaminase isoform X2 [Ooceraea biroi]EZA47341.1 Deoxycytidylate deaminase [Ooceraea biroi]
MAETSYNGSPRNNMLHDDYWDEHFMTVAALSMTCTNGDPKVGACVVDDNRRIVSIGYNEMSRGCSDDEFPWNPNPINPWDYRGFYVCHAELTAIIDAMRTSIDLNKCTIYTTLFPCNECAKLIIRSGIRRVIYATAKYPETRTESMRRIFNAAGVTFRQYKLKRSQIFVNLPTHQ